VAEAGRARQWYLQQALRGTAAATFAVALAGVLLPGRAGNVVAAVALGIVVATPLLRLVWLAVRWARKGDWRYCGVATAVLVIVASGALLA
jgi:uncharacterized membrane protein